LELLELLLALVLLLVVVAVLPVVLPVVLLLLLVLLLPGRVGIGRIGIGPSPMQRIERFQPSTGTTCRLKIEDCRLKMTLNRLVEV
jgi:hypothetical protein